MPPTSDRNTQLDACSFESSRIFAAPRDRVFRAFTDPAHLLHWWGPKGFTNTFQTFEPVVGGVWRFVMHGPDGTNHQNENRFLEFVENERIVMEHVTNPHFVMLMAFTDEAGGTRLSWTMTFDSSEICAQIQSFAVEANQQNYDRLEARLKIMAGERPVSTSRNFGEPRP